MESTKEIMDMLKTILEKVERLENINADNITINSGTITINGGTNQTVDIEDAEDVMIQAIGDCAISIENAENVDGLSFNED